MVRPRIRRLDGEVHMGELQKLQRVRGADNRHSARRRHRGTHAQAQRRTHAADNRGERRLLQGQRQPLRGQPRDDVRLARGPVVGLPLGRPPDGGRPRVLRL